MQPETALEARQQLYRQLRQYFADRQVLEVETPLLGTAGTTDPQIESFVMQADGAARYLQTSPEFFLKRLVAATGRSLYSLGKVFRAGEVGRWHNPEFTMLEWYRVGFNLDAIMDDTCQLVAAAMGRDSLEVERISYRQLFENQLGFNPHRVDFEQVQRAVANHTSYSSPLVSVSEGLQLLMDQLIEPTFSSPFTLVYHFPQSQAALARLTDQDGDPVAERFELYAGQVELANGYHELTDADEQAGRFQADLETRRQLGLPAVEPDQKLVDALRRGLPDCAGVSVGIDRLLAILLQQDSIAAVLFFDWTRA